MPFSPQQTLFTTLFWCIFLRSTTVNAANCDAAWTVEGISKHLAGIHDLSGCNGLSSFTMTLAPNQDDLVKNHLIDIMRTRVRHISLNLKGAIQTTNGYVAIVPGPPTTKSFFRTLDPREKYYVPTNNVPLKRPQARQFNSMPAITSYAGSIKDLMLSVSLAAAGLVTGSSPIAIAGVLIVRGLICVAAWYGVSTIIDTYTVQEDIKSQKLDCQKFNIQRTYPSDKGGGTRNQMSLKCAWNSFMQLGATYDSSQAIEVLYAAPDIRSDWPYIQDIVEGAMNWLDASNAGEFVKGLAQSPVGIMLKSNEKTLSGILEEVVSSTTLLLISGINYGMFMNFGVDIAGTFFIRLNFELNGEGRAWQITSATNMPRTTRRQVVVANSASSKYLKESWGSFVCPQNQYVQVKNFSNCSATEGRWQVSDCKTDNVECGASVDSEGNTKIIRRNRANNNGLITSLEPMCKATLNECECPSVRQPVRQVFQLGNPSSPNAIDVTDFYAFFVARIKPETGSFSYKTFDNFGIERLPASDTSLDEFDACYQAVKQTQSAAQNSCPCMLNNDSNSTNTTTSNNNTVPLNTSSTQEGVLVNDQGGMLLVVEPVPEDVAIFGALGPVVTQLQLASSMFQLRAYDFPDGRPEATTLEMVEGKCFAVEFLFSQSGASSCEKRAQFLEVFNLPVYTPGDPSKSWLTHFQAMEIYDLHDEWIGGCKEVRTINTTTFESRIRQGNMCMCRVCAQKLGILGLAYPTYIVPRSQGQHLLPGIISVSALAMLVIATAHFIIK